MDWEDTSVDYIGREWHQYFQNELESDLKLDYKQISYRLCKCSDNGIDFEMTDREKHHYISFLVKIPQLYDKLKHWPTDKQKLLVLAIAKMISLNEKTFIEINSNDTYNSLVKMAEVTETTTSTAVKVRYIDMLCSFVEHDAGLKWTLETQYWTRIWDLVMQCQKENCDSVDQNIYNILSNFLQKTSKCAPKICQHVIKQMIQPIIGSADKHYPKTKKQPIELFDPQECRSFSQTIEYLIGIMERLLADNQSPSNALKYFLTSKLRESCDTLVLLSNNFESGLQLNRILTILCFYEMTALFDGIKVVNQDPLVLSGFLKIVDKEMKKENFDCIWELFYYAQKYWDYNLNQMPKYFQKGKSIDIKLELTAFQLEPVVLLGEKLSKKPFPIPETTSCEELLKDVLISDMTSGLSEGSLQLGYEIRTQYFKAPMGSELTALKCALKTKPYYSRKCLAMVLQSLVFALKDFIKYIKNDVELAEIEHNQLIAEGVLEVILVVLEDFDLSWRESLGSLEMSKLNYEFFSCSTKWNSNVFLLILKILNITTLKNLSANMILLVDFDSDHHVEKLNEMGVMLLDKCASSNLEIRETAMTVVRTICQKINEGFASFKQVLFHIVTPEVILNRAINDSNHAIRSIALTCLQEMILMEEFQETLLSTTFIDKILELITKELDPMALKVTLKLMRHIYKNDKNDMINNLLEIYRVMSRVAIQERNADVQEEAVRFWEFVITKNLEKQGMIDDSFPDVTFSKEHKRIIRLDEKEIRKRLTRALDNMSKTGCFNVYLQILENPETSGQVFAETLSVITKLSNLLSKYDVTPEFISNNQAYPHAWSIDSGIVSPESTWVDTDEHMKELIEETVMEMINGEICDISCIDAFSLASSFIETEQFLGLLNHTADPMVQVTTLEFMEFIYRMLPSFSER